jgi:hypothetical protein
VAALGRNYGRQLIDMTFAASAATMSTEQAVAFLKGLSEHLRDMSNIAGSAGNSPRCPARPLASRKSAEPEKTRARTSQPVSLKLQPVYPQNTAAPIRNRTCLKRTKRVL